jgi:hypothetical protein
LDILLWHYSIIIFIVYRYLLIDYFSMMKYQCTDKKYLCIPGTSVPFERLFSTGGNICTDYRTSLSPDHAEQLIFLSKNYPLFITLISMKKLLNFIS